MHIFHRYDTTTRMSISGYVAELRACSTCNHVQGYSNHLRGWEDLDFLKTTAHDELMWLRHGDKFQEVAQVHVPISPKNSPLTFWGWLRKMMFNK